MKTGCLGPEGSYSEQAAKILSPDSELILYRNFPAVVRSLKTGETDEIVLPIENTIQGGVLQNMDLLAEEDDLFAVKEYILKIDHRLLTQKGVPMSEVKRVFSHPQAIGQCSIFLSEALSGAQTVPTESTAQGLQKMTERTDACIIGRHMCNGLEEKYDVTPDTIADEKKNYTYFELVKKGKEWLDKHSEFVYFVAELPDVPGSLYSLLGVIDKYGLNMNKIESRPIKTKPGEYRFFIEIEGDYLSPKIQKAIEKIQEKCSKFKLLGSY